MGVCGQECRWHSKDKLGLITGNIIWEVRVRVSTDLDWWIGGYNISPTPTRTPTHRQYYFGVGCSWSGIHRKRCIPYTPIQVFDLGW